MYDFLIVGAGITGITLAERLAGDGAKVLLIDRRDHIGGNCYDFRDGNGIIVQKYGPHIFHTRSRSVFDYLSRFTEWNDYRHKVIACHRGEYYPIPINRDTINSFYGIELRSEEETEEFLRGKRIAVGRIANSRDVVISKFGEELYEAFVKHYTKKQWDHYPEELDRSVLERLPVRYDTNPYFFDDPYQGMPLEGFTKMFDGMLAGGGITVELGTDFFARRKDFSFGKLIFTGRIDRFFDFRHGALQYRCMKFVFQTEDAVDYQPNSVVNFTDPDVEQLRVTEFRKFYLQTESPTVICREHPSWEGEPAYPVINGENRALRKKYLDEAAHLEDVYFAGRLGTHRYLDIDTAVERAIELHEKIRHES